MKTYFQSRSILLSLSLIVFSSGNAQEYELSGVLQYFLFGETTNTVVKQAEGSFRVSVKDCHWLISSHRTDQRFDYVQSGMDGSGVYTLWNSERAVKEDEKRTGTVHPGVNTETGLIDEGSVLYCTASELNSRLWLAFASNCYLSTNTTGKMPHIFPSDADDTESVLRNAPYEFQWRKMSDDSPFPASLFVFDDGVVRSWDSPETQAWFLPYKETRREAPFDKGFTNHVYEVNDYERHGAIDVPTKSTFKRLVPKSRNPKSPADLRILELYSFSVTNVASAVSVSDFRPTIRGRIIVSDRRFFNAPEPVFNFAYDPKRKWLSKEEAKELPEYLQQKASQASQIAMEKREMVAAKLVQKRSPRARTILVVVMISISVLFFYGCRKMFQNTQKQNKTV